MYVELSLTEEEIIELINYDIKYAKKLSSTILCYPNILRNAVYNFEYRNYLVENKMQMLDANYVMRNLLKTDSNYINSDGTVNRENFELLDDIFDIINNVDMRMHFIYKMMDLSNDSFPDPFFEWLLNMGINTNEIAKLSPIVCANRKISTIEKYFECVEINEETRCEILNHLRDYKINVVHFILRKNWPLSIDNMKKIIWTSGLSRETLKLLIKNPYFQIMTKSISFVHSCLSHIFTHRSEFNRDDFDNFIEELDIDLSNYKNNFTKLIDLLDYSKHDIVEHMIAQGIFDLNHVSADGCIIECLTRVCREGDNKVTDVEFYLDSIALFLKSDSFILTEGNISAMEHFNLKTNNLIMKKLQNDPYLLEFAKKKISETTFSDDKNDDKNDDDYDDDE